MKKRIILGDVHGRLETVKQIYKNEQPDEVILLGDYADSRDNISPRDIKYCVIELLRLQHRHNIRHNNHSFIMLIGNHDFHYFTEVQDQQYSGYNWTSRWLLQDIYKDNIKNGSLQYVFIDKTNKTIYSHAGVTNTWLREVCENNEIELINEFPEKWFRFFYGYGNRYSQYGDSEINSPIWVRPYSLSEDYYKDSDGNVWNQIVGHTRARLAFAIKENHLDQKAYENENINYPLIFIDSLPYFYLIQEIDDNNIITKTYCKKHDKSIH